MYLRSQNMISEFHFLSFVRITKSTFIIILYTKIPIKPEVVRREGIIQITVLRVTLGRFS